MTSFAIAKVGRTITIERQDAKNPAKNIKSDNFSGSNTEKKTI